MVILGSVGGDERGLSNRISDGIIDDKLGI